MFTYDDIITGNEEMLENIIKAKKYMDKDVPVMIYGETGTGKELFAQAIHSGSSKRTGEFVAQNCSNLARGVFESMMWGVSKGAFTGSVEKAGLFEVASGGTILLDEINSMEIAQQAKLLRVIENKRVLRVGASKSFDVDVKIITSMNDTPQNVLDKGIIRKDLFFRLAAGTLRMVPLRERPEDIDLYIDYFIGKYNEKYNEAFSGVTDELRDMFNRHNWPGNVRELKQCLEAACILAKGNIVAVDDMPSFYFDLGMSLEVRDEVNFNPPEQGGRCSENTETDKTNCNLAESVRKYENEIIRKALIKTGGNITKTAKMLGIPRQTLQYKIDRADSAE